MANTSITKDFGIKLSHSEIEWIEKQEADMNRLTTAVTMKKAAVDRTKRKMAADPVMQKFKKDKKDLRNAQKRLNELSSNYCAVIISKLNGMKSDDEIAAMLEDMQKQIQESSADSKKQLTGRKS